MQLNNTHRMCYCISTATMVKITSHKATLSVQCLSCYLVFMKFISVTMHAIRKCVCYEHSHGEEVFTDDMDHNLPCNTFQTVSMHCYVRKPGTPNEQFR